jgi:hypothetical protein
MRLPVRSIDPPSGVPAHHDFSSTGDLGAFFIADIANYARVSPYALNFVRIIEGQKLDASVVDGEPNLDLYQLTRFFVGTEPLSIALDGAFQLWCHRLVPVPKGESKTIGSTILPQLE